MKLQEDKDKVLAELEKELKKDRIKNNIVHFTDLGLVEMTRKRVGRNLSYFYEESCPKCSGTGKVKSIEATMELIVKEIREVASDKDVSKIYLKTRKEIVKKINELYLDIISEYLKSRKKEIVLITEEMNNTLGYEILLEK